MHSDRVSLKYLAHRTIWEAKLKQSVIILLSSILFSLNIAFAQDGVHAVELAEELPVPTFNYERIIPRHSFELSVSISYGTIAYWRDWVPPWIGMGVRFGWGKHFGSHRVGLDLSGGFEGPVPVHFSAPVELMASWYYISPKKLIVGVGLGPALMVHSRVQVHSPETTLGVSPSLALRFGYSEGWAKMERRVFVYLEPKIRMVDGVANPLVSIVVGSGTGI